MTLPAIVRFWTKLTLLDASARTVTPSSALSRIELPLISTFCVRLLPSLSLLTTRTPSEPLLSTSLPVIEIAWLIDTPWLASAQT